MSVLMAATRTGSSATPAGGTLTPASGTLTYTAGPFNTPNPSAQANGVPICNAALPCDNYTLTLNAASVAATKNVKVQIQWPSQTADFDLYVLDSSNTLVKASASQADPETAIFPVPANGTVYTVRVAPFNPVGQSFTGTISLIDKPAAPPQGAGISPRYQNYKSPSNMGNNAGEPSIGVDWNPNDPTLKHDKVNTGGVSFFQSGPNTLRTSFDDCSSPAKHVWDDVSTPLVQQAVLSDPIGFVDHYGTQPSPGRVFSVDLIGGQGNSLLAYSDDDGKTYLPGQGGGSPAGPDHQTVGGGPYRSDPAALPPVIPPPHPTYPNAIYYCSQNIAANAECSRSDDGGKTFGPGVVIFQNVAGCTGGIHGHVKVAPDGTVYVPNSSCSVGTGTQGIAISTDNGLTWTDRTIPGSTGSGDPSIGVGVNTVGLPVGQTTNTIYLGYVNGDGHPRIATSHDRGLTWVNDQDVGAIFGIQNIVFPAVVAGDDNRAAFGFLGTTSAGDPNNAATFGNAVWHLYIATTYDGGQTYITVDTTPDDPVQIGSICLAGLSCGDDRNLLDFNDFTVDKEGRPLFGYADGCIAPGCNATSQASASRSSKATISRQAGGRRLFVANDPVEASVPGAPRLEAPVTRDASGVKITWSVPDDGASPITSYNIYRGATSGSETLLTNFTPTRIVYTGATLSYQVTFNDASADPAQTYWYKVTAVNAQGEGLSCGELNTVGATAPPTGQTDSCTGVNVVTDPSGDAINPAPGGQGPTDQADITAISFSKNGANLVVTMKLKNLTLTPSPGTSFTAYHVAWTSSNGKMYATEVDEPDPNGLSVFWGEWDPGSNQLTTFNSTTATVTQGANGTIAVNVPLSGIGNPTIPITDPNGTPAVRDPYGINIAGEGAIGAGLVFNTPMDRAPDSGFGQRWAVCAPVVAGPATHFAISAPASIAPNTAFNATVTALDANNNTATGYTGTVHFTSSDGAATLPANYTFTAGDAGVHTFTFTLRTSGNQTITATDTATASITGSATVSVGSGPPPGNACLNAPTQVVTDPSGDQGAANPAQADIQSISIGEDYQFINSDRLVFKLKVANLTTVPANQVWRVRWTFGATTYYVAMTSDSSSNVNYEYGTVSGSTVATVGGIESGSFANDGTITLIIATSKVGSPTAGSVLTAVNGVTQSNVGGAGTLFTGEDSTSSANYTMRAKDAACSSVPLPPPPGSATYVKGGMTFSPNHAVYAPYIGQDVEPSVRTDKFGNAYVAPIRGVPGGTDLWYFDLRPTVNGAANPNYDPYMRNPIYRGQPDSISGSSDASVGGDGGGDVDMAVGFNSEATENPSAPPTLAYSSLVLGNISTQRSTDRGATFVKNPAGNVTGGVPGDDRQWMEFLGSNTVYLIYRTLAPAIAQVQRSIDGGLTYGPSVVVGTIGQVGGVDVDQNDGTVYLSGSSGVVAVGIPVVAGQEPVTYTVHNVAGTGNAHLFFTVKVAADGTVYACYSDDHNIFIKYSKDKGNTWSPAIRVSDGPETNTSVFPWMETGPTPGTIGVVWYGSDKATTGDDSADWNVYYALGTNVTTSPTFRQGKASDHVIHGANISESGLVVGGMSPNRNLADYFQVSFDPTGAAVIGYCDDHNDISGHTFVARQIGGPGVNNGAAIPSPVEGSALPAPILEPKPTAASIGGIAGSQVTDFKDDVRSGGNPQTGGTVVLPNDDPLDILTIKYSAEGNTSGQPVLVATMKVSDMTAITPSSNWRMHFTANAPNSVLSPTGEYTFGVSDRGDQFFLRATTDSSGGQTFVYGTAKRNFDGSITYTDKGTADSGVFNQANKTITIKVALSKLNAALAAGRTPLAGGSILVGLRGTTFTTAGGSGNNRTDTARGGTQYTIDPAKTNYALATLGSIAIPSSTYGNGGFPASSAIDGEHKGLNWGNNGGWNDNTRTLWPDSLEVDFSASKVINEIRVYTLQNNFKNPVEPTTSTPADLYGLLDFDVQTWNGTAWVTVTGGSVTGNDKAMRVFTFPDTTTTKVRVVVNGARSNWSRILEVEAFGISGQ